MNRPITLARLLPDDRPGLLKRPLISLADRVLGIDKMNTLYLQHQMAGLDKEDFARRLIEILEIQVNGIDTLQASIPSSGPVVITSNHPFGGIEGVILSLAISQVRPDLKVLANQGLKLFSELSDYFIFTNPLSEKDPRNGPSLRACKRHLKNDGALLIFPAGRVSYYQPDKRRISEHNWNRLAGHLLRAVDGHLVPVFVDGLNSRWFYRLGRIYYRLRMMMLARELLNKRGQKITIQCGTPVPSQAFSQHPDTQEMAACNRILSYCQQGNWRYTWPPDTVRQYAPLAVETSPDSVEQEISQLPAEQHLLDYRQYAVYYGMQHQLPGTVAEIARLREWVFRQHNEGSGAPRDTDNFDATYTHLFVFNRESRQIIGAYRMGQTDKLLADGNIRQLYLARMFDFGKDFVNQRTPCLELGRSFLIPEYQRSYQGLFLLWRGIGAFVCRFPQYRTLYGTVSISKLYDPRSVAIIQHALVTPTDKVRANHPFGFSIHPEIRDFSKQYALREHLPALLAGIERDGKQLPVLAKHYARLGAQFHSLGIDPNFNHTPGLLLSVHLPDAPQKALKQYLAEGLADYLRHPA